MSESTGAAGIVASGRGGVGQTRFLDIRVYSECRGQPWSQRAVNGKGLHDLAYVFKVLLWLLRGGQAMGGEGGSGGGWETSREIIQLWQQERKDGLDQFGRRWASGWR